MNMTKLGKILVFVNLAFGVALFSWALGVYTNRIDFSNKPPEGAVLERANRVKQTVENLNNFALPRWTAARVALKNSEDVRAANRNYYIVQLENLKTGGQPKAVPPVLIPSYVNGVIQIAPTGQPKMEDAKLVDSNNGPLKFFDFYAQEMSATQKKIDVELAAIRALIDQEKKLTEELSGPDGNGGYRGQVDREKVREQRIHEETEDLKPLIVNTRVESELLLKRQRQLVARLKELEARAAR